MNSKKIIEFSIRNNRVYTQASPKFPIFSLVSIMNNIYSIKKKKETWIKLSTKNNERGGKNGHK